MRHILDNEYVPRCDNCVHKGKACVAYAMAKQLGYPTDQCNYYTSEKHMLGDEASE